MKIFKIFPCILLVVSCNSDEIGSTKDVRPESIYFDYKIWGEEGQEEVTCKLQFRFGGEHGTTLVLDEPSKVELDGEVIKPDSAKLSGAYYELQKPSAAFSGKHSIVFTDPDGKQYKEEFSFSPFKLKVELPSSVSRNDWVFYFEGLKPLDFLTVIIIDTSFESDDVYETDTVKNGRLVIPKEKLSGLVTGPVTVQFSREEEKSVRNGTREGGKIAISYGLKREFELTD